MLVLFQAEADLSMARVIITIVQYQLPHQVMVDLILRQVDPRVDHSAPRNKMHFVRQGFY